MIFAAINKSQGKGREGAAAHAIPTILPAAYGTPGALAQVRAQACPDCNHILMANISEPRFIERRNNKNTHPCSYMIERYCAGKQLCPKPAHGEKLAGDAKVPADTC